MGVLEAIHELKKDADIAYPRKLYVPEKFFGFYFELFGTQDGVNGSISGRTYACC